jgi:hypothetical protein
MASYTFYRPADGEITHTISCPETDIHLNVKPGEQYIDGQYGAAEYTIQNGAAVKRAVPLDMLEMMKRPPV